MDECGELIGFIIAKRANALVLSCKIYVYKIYMSHFLTANEDLTGAKTGKGSFIRRSLTIFGASLFANRTNRWSPNFGAARVTHKVSYP